jgi:4-diphosphocytidyl-2-C-methyl-D-erythritol kinase
MRVARVSAQAKVNLLLRVGARDSSGYHAISTWFLRLDLSDEIVVRVGGNVRAIDVAGPRVPPGGLGPPEKNLAYRAAVAYAERTGWPRGGGFSIELTKNIPVGGGLGGGSADAGAVLRALDALAAAPIRNQALVELAVLLGSDVPFLTSEFIAAFGTGRGEKLQPIDALPARDVVLVVPDFAISTPDAYRWLDESRPSVPPPQELQTWLVPRAALTSWELLSETPLHTNDFESVLERRHPALLRFRERLSSRGAQIAHLAGSGSAVFGVFDGSPPSAGDLSVDALVIPTRTSSRVVQVEVLE